VEVLLHPMRRAGGSNLQDPVQRFGGLCAYENCPEMARAVRLTQAGYAVSYCKRHNLLAREWFNGHDR
jgi:hypothetical protein